MIKNRTARQKRNQTVCGVGTYRDYLSPVHQIITQNENENGRMMYMKRKKLPKWVEQFPQTPLNGQTYHHLVYCSASKKKPLGSSGCICLKSLKVIDKL